MAGGQKIDDHSFWAGKAPAGRVFPEQAMMKEEKSADGAGELMNYEDTTEKIKTLQDMGEGKVKRYPQKPLHRN